MSKPLHINSYYGASANTMPECLELESHIQCDVCVVGAGITGLSTALHLAERGYDVVVLESARIGWGASGRSGGQVLSGYACGMDKLKDMLGKQDAQRLWHLSLEAVELVRERVTRHNIQCDLKPGHLSVALKPRQQAELQHWKAELEREYGYAGLRLLKGEALRDVIETNRYIAGLYDPYSAHLHPLNYTLGLAQAALRAGVRIFEGSPAFAIKESANPVIEGLRGRVTCRYLALCGNAYLDRPQVLFRSKIMPVGTYIIATEPLGTAKASALLPTDTAVADLNFVLDYFRLAGDNRMLFGGRVSYSTLEPRNLARALQARMLKVFPQLKDVKVEYAWGGYVAITMNRAPHFGRLADNVYFVQGFSGHGMALTGLAGKLMAEAIAGTAERFDAFARIRHRSFPGGRLLRMPMLVLAMTYYRLRDLL